MARATLMFEGIQTLNDLARAVMLAEAVGFPPNAAADSPVSGIAGARFSVTCGLHLIPEPGEEDDDV